jgi:hypothetical protein
VRFAHEPGWGIYEPVTGAYTYRFGNNTREEAVEAAKELVRALGVDYVKDPKYALNEIT